MRTNPRIVAPLLALGALVVGVGLAVVFIVTKPKTERVAPTPLPPRVNVIDVPRGEHLAELSALGTLIPAEQVRLQPEVSGVVIDVHPRLVPGGVVDAGARLVRIDPRNYRIAVEQARAQVARAEVDLRLERGRARVAEKEWSLLEGSAGGEADRDLALRKPQLDNARAALASARSALRRAELDLSRTVLRAPFDAFVQEESVDEGQVVAPGNSVTTLVGTSAFWAQVSLPPKDLEFLVRPKPDGSGGSRARIIRRGPGDARLSREGRVVRVLGDLDPRGKMARVLVEIEDPLGLTSEAPPFLLGSVVEVRIEGRAIDEVYVVPRLALRGGDEVWTVEDGKLAIRPVEVVWRGKDRVFVRAELGRRSRVVTSRLATPVAGMEVRIEGAAERRAEVR